MNKIVSIQYLRAIAALMVVMFHAFYPSYANFRIAGGNFFQFGRMGVDIFFILSGFVMSIIVATEKTPAVFIKKRMARIYPTYWQIYFATIILWVIFHGIFHLKFMPRGSWFVNLSLLPFESKITETLVLDVSWTLYYEVFFYLILAASLYFFRQARHGVHLFFAANLLCFIIAPELEKISQFDKNYFFEFVAGFCAMEFLKKKNPLDLVIVVISIYILYLVSFRNTAWIYCIGALIFLNIGMSDFFKKLPEIKILKMLGDSSYSLYLIHLPILGIGNALAAGVTNNFVLWISVAGWIFFAVILSWLNYEFFEKKIAKKLRKFC